MITSWTWGRVPMAYCSTSDDFLFLLHFALVFWKRHGSILRFHVGSIWRHRHLLISPPMWQPHPIFFAKYPVFRNYRIMWQQYLTLTAALAARILHSPIIRSLVFIFTPFFCKIKVKINFFFFTFNLISWQFKEIMRKLFHQVFWIRPFLSFS